MATEPSYLPGITLRSVSACLLAMAVMVVVHVFGETLEGNGWFYSMNILAFPAVAAFLAVFGPVAAAHGLFGVRLLTRAELVCVLFCLLIAVPVMGMGFWTNFIWLSSTIPSQGDFEKMDAVRDGLWPHGPNLLEGVLRPEAPGVTVLGNVAWRDTAYDRGRRASVPALCNGAPDEASAVRLRVPLEEGDRPILTLGERYLLSVLARGRDMGPEAVLLCRIYYDDHAVFDIEAFTQPRPDDRVTYLHREGFQRYGVYGIEFGTAVREHVDVEFRLSGRGTVELADPKLMSVAAFESLFAGRTSVSEGEYGALRPSERAAVAVRPDSWWSPTGLRYLASGPIPLRAWWRPVTAWLSLILLLLLATQAVALIMRRQWVRNERYPLPMARIPSALLGVGEGDGEGPALPAVWRNRTAWLGFATGLIWCLLRVWHSYNPNVPNTEIAVALTPYFDDPGWGRMWTGVTFNVSLAVVCLAVFMELNILLSLVAGFFLYRSLHWIGEVYGWNVASAGKYGIGAFPYADEQMIGAYFAYGILTVFFVRRYLWQALKKAWRPAAPPEPTADSEPFSYRAAFGMLALSFLGTAGWAGWIGIRPHAMLVLFAAMVLMGFVAMKLRAECGTPFAWFTPGTRLLIPLLGGMAFFGAEATMVSSWMSVGMVLLFIVPGLQMEFVEVARRSRIVPRHVLYTLLLGVCGGMVVGGWFFLSSLYGIGSNQAGMNYWFTARPWEFYPYIDYQRVADAGVAEAAQATAVAREPATGSGFDPSMAGYAGAAAATAVVTLLRQRFPGFWFHPIAVILGGTAEGLGMHMYWSFNLWGSLLTAWAIRWSVLKIGGAAAVRDRLFPFFVGAFVAAMLAQLLVFGVNGYLYFFDPTAARSGLML